MPTRPVRPGSVLWNVRAYFNLTQQELALYLGVSEGLIGHVEAGRRDLSARLRARLRPLLEQLPPGPTILEERPLEPGAPLPAAPPLAVAPAAEPLRARLDECLARAYRLRPELTALERRVTFAARWQTALPGLLAVLPADEEGEVIGHWLRVRVPPLRPAEVARWQLLRIQWAALTLEIDALRGLLAG